jgi:two-component system sensor histidine kinase KdpD
MLAFRLGAKPPSTAFGILAVFIVVAVSGLVVAALESIAEPASLGIVFIPGVLLIATVWGLWLGLGTALLSALVFNFYFLPPLRNFSINARHDIVALLVFVLVAVVSGTLAELARARAAESERRRREADRALREAAALAEERDRMREEAIEAEALRRSDELKTSLLRSVSHDLRTPLTAIIAAGAALDSPSVTADERRELSDAVVDEGQRLSRLVENLLDVSRLEAGAAEPHREPVELGDLLMAARESIGANGEHVRLSLDDDLPALRADPTQLERAFANLLENAVVHGEGQPVLVRSRLVGSRLVVRVVDRGPGIPESQRERIFEPFYRAPGARPGSGSGLGLAIARGFIEANGGEVEVESLPGQGSSFVVTFGDLDGKPAAAPDGVGG